MSKCVLPYYLVGTTCKKCKTGSMRNSLRDFKDAQCVNMTTCAKNGGFARSVMEELSKTTVCADKLKLGKVTVGGKKITMINGKSIVKAET